ncbi:hypothetical protein ACHAWX_003812 [Stephanocyclus meneghinianus]
MFSNASMLRLLTLGGIAANALDAPTHTIVGGYEIKPNSRPYLVSVGAGKRAYEGLICGGTLVSPRAVMTAAHCLFQLEATLQWSPPEWVEFHRYDLSNDTGVIRLYLKDRSQCDGDVVYHPGYDYLTKENDVAVLFLPTAINLITPVTLNTDPNVPISNAPLDVAGWGLTENGYPHVPHAVTLEYVTNEACTKKPYRYKDESIAYSMMCASAEGKDSCSADSGGPLVLGKGGRKGGPQNPVVQVGIVSWGQDRCANDRFPGVYTRVSAISDFVKDTVCARTGDLCRDSKPGEIESGQGKSGKSKFVGNKSGESKSSKGRFRRLKSKSDSKGTKTPDTSNKCIRLPTFSPTISSVPTQTFTPTTAT